MDKKFIKDFDSGFGALERINFMSDLLDKQNEIRNILDTRANIIIALNSALIVFFITEFKTFSETYALMIASVIALVAVFISVLCAILALKPPAMQTKKGQPESIFYHHYIESKTLEEYMEEAHKALHSEKDIYKQYILEAYNLTVYSNIPRKYYLNLAIRVLILGIIFAAVTFMVIRVAGFALSI